MLHLWLSTADMASYLLNMMALHRSKHVWAVGCTQAYMKQACHCHTCLTHQLPPNSTETPVPQRLPTPTKTTPQPKHLG